MPTIRELLGAALFEGGNAFDLFARLCAVLSSRDAAPVVQRLHLRQRTKIGDEADVIAEELSPTLPSADYFTMGRRRGLLANGDDIGLLRAVWVWVIAIDRACDGIRIADHNSTLLSGWHIELLRERRKLNVASDGMVLPRGPVAADSDNKVLAELINLTYVPRDGVFADVDYDVLPADQVPLKSWWEPWKIGFVSVAQMDDELRVTRVDADGPGYSVVPDPAQSAAMAARVVKSVAALRSEGADVVLLPECAVDDGIYRAVEAWMRAADGPMPIVIAGTRNVPGPGGVPYNRATGLCNRGEALWSQDKLHPYDIPADTADGWAINDMLKLNAGEVAKEYMAPAAARLVVRDCPLGRLLILICQDFSNQGRIRPILEHLTPTHIFVPVFDAPLHKNRWHVRDARDVEQLAASVFVCNSLYIESRQRKFKKKPASDYFAYVSTPKRRHGDRVFLPKSADGHVIWSEKSL